MPGEPATNAFMALGIMIRVPLKCIDGGGLPPSHRSNITFEPAMPRSCCYLVLTALFAPCMAFFAALNFACLAFNVSSLYSRANSVHSVLMAAHLVPGPLSAHVEDQLLLRAGLLHGVHGGLVRALRRDMRTLLLQGQFMVIYLVVVLGW